MKNIEFPEPSSRATEITPARSEVSYYGATVPHIQRRESKLRNFFFPVSVDASGVPRIIAVDFLRGVRIYMIILSMEINEMLDLERSHLAVGYMVSAFSYFLSFCRFILCQMTAIYGAYTLCQSNNSTRELAKIEIRNVLISVSQVPIWLMFDITQAQMRKVASGTPFVLDTLTSNAYPDMNIHAYFSLMWIVYQFFQMVLFFPFCRLGKIAQIKALAGTSLALSFVWFFVTPFISKAINPAMPEAPLYRPMNGGYRDYFVGLFSNFVDGRRFSFMQLFPLHLQGIYYGALFSLFKRLDYGRWAKIGLVAIPAAIGAVLQYPYACYTAFLVSAHVRSYATHPFAFVGYREPAVLTQEFVIFLSLWQSVMILASFAFFEAPTTAACDSRANKCLAIRRYSTLAWWGVGRNYCTSIFLRQLFGTRRLTWAFIPYLLCFVVLDHLVICATDCFKCVFTHDWILAATRSWMNSKPLTDMQDLHRKVCPAYLALKKVDPQQDVVDL